MCAYVCYVVYVCIVSMNVMFMGACVYLICTYVLYARMYVIYVCKVCAYVMYVCVRMYVMRVIRRCYVGMFFECMNVFYVCTFALCMYVMLYMLVRLRV